MKKINLEFMYDEKGRKIGVMLKYKQFDDLFDYFEDWVDLQFLKNYKRVPLEKCIPMEEVFKKLEKR